MGNCKKDVIQFFVWMRNGSAFGISWFLVLWLMHNHVFGIEDIATDELIKMILFVVGGAFLFSVAFTRLFIKKWTFLGRLTCFMVLISVYECIAFYCTGFWRGNGTRVEWFAFIGIVLGLYFICIGIYQIYSKKQGELYTLALQEYQKKRSMEYEK